MHYRGNPLPLSRETGPLTRPVNHSSQPLASKRPLRSTNYKTPISRFCEEEASITIHSLFALSSLSQYCVAVCTLRRGGKTGSRLFKLLGRLFALRRYSTRACATRLSVFSLSRAARLSVDHFGFPEKKRVSEDAL